MGYSSGGDVTKFLSQYPDALYNSSTNMLQNQAGSQFYFLQRGEEIPAEFKDVTANKNSGLPESYIQALAANQQPAASIASPTGIKTAPTYEQFAGAQANANPEYTGGNVPGMSAGDNAMLNDLYAPLPTQKDGGIAGYAKGGIPQFKQKMSRYEHKHENIHPGTGFLNSSVAGRTDRLPVAVASDSYVIPADVVSGLGQGNSLAGAKLLNQALKTGPYGTEIGKHKDGGSQKHMPIIVAGGEHIVPPEAVSRLGAGDMKKGHKLLDELVAKVRKHTLKTIKALPKPK